MTDTQYKTIQNLLFRLEKDAEKHYPPFADRICEIRTAHWLFNTEEIPLLGEVS